MVSIQGTGRIKRLSGVTDGKCISIKDMLCVRKHLIRDKEWRQVKSSEKTVAFVSSPKIYGQKELLPLVHGWCHAFKNDSILPNDAKKVLLPESDFLDKDFVCFSSNTIKYDYFYFTVNSNVGVISKGLNVFLDSLPILNKHRLKGMVVVYFPNSGGSQRFVMKLNDKCKKNLQKYRHDLKFHWGYLTPSQLNNVMTSCRFGFFPNVVDNSPRLISECLLRNVPVLINENIHGGWHYVSNDTGSLFNMKNLDQSLEFMLNNKFGPRDYFMQNYGFKRSCSRFAAFINEVFGTSYQFAYFRDFETYLQRLVE